MSEHREWMRLRALYMHERLNALSPEERAKLTAKDLDNHQRGASQRATIELRKRAEAAAIRARWATDAADPKRAAESEAIKQQQQAERQLNLEELRLLVARLPGDCKESPPCHFRRYKPRGLTHGFLQCCKACDRVACRIHDGKRNRGGFRCEHYYQSVTYDFTMLELPDRTFLFFERSHLPHQLLVGWIRNERVKEFDWFDPKKMPEEELRQRVRAM